MHWVPDGSADGPVNQPTDLPSNQYTNQSNYELTDQPTNSVIQCCVCASTNHHFVKLAEI